MDLFVDAGRSLVAEVAGEAECLVTTAAGVVRHLNVDLPMSCVTGVTTSRVARKQGLAGRLTAKAIAQDVADGAHVAALGMFEQGYYDRLGFGTGGYEHLVALDPARLDASRLPIARVPRRVTADDWEAVHANRLQRHRSHGACNLTSPLLTKAEMLEHKNGFGLGYDDSAGGGLSHHVFCGAKEDVKEGPYWVWWLAWTTPAQLLELLALLRNLGDQVNLVRLREPAGVQLQDLMDKPFQRFRISERTKFEATTGAVAYWQMRICDVGECLAATRLSRGEIRFNLRLSDPIETRLPEDASWRGVAGDYVVTLGATSGATTGRDTTLPTLSGTVNAFTRLWLGVRPATGLAITDDLEGPPELLEALDDVLRLPAPHPDWDF